MTKLSRNATAVYYYLQGRRTPKIQQIAKALHLSKSTVFRAIKELETAGLLTRENRCQGGQKSNLYRIGDDKNV